MLNTNFQRRTVQSITTMTLFLFNFRNFKISVSMRLCKIETRHINEHLHVWPEANFHL